MTNANGAKRFPFSSAILWLVLSSFVMVTALPGCSGCRPEDPVAKKKREDEEKKKKKKKTKKDEPKPDFEATQLATLPADTSTTKNNYVKPGHWTTSLQSFMANNFNFRGEIDAESVDVDGRRVDVEKTPFQITATRPIVLPKGQQKYLEMQLPIPRQRKVQTELGVTKTENRIAVGLRSDRGGKVLQPSNEVLTTMPDHQFFFVVLTRRTDRYGFIKLTGATRGLSGQGSSEDLLYYRVQIPKISDATSAPVPVPSHPLTWTSTAYVLWDDFLPSRLSSEQQDALIDWLHWGGQLIVSGPNSMDSLKQSFLEPYLPADKAKAVDLDAAAFAELNNQWSLHSRKKNELMTLNVLPTQPLSGIELQLRLEGDFVKGTGRLVAERRVGQGRIVLTAFPLDHKSVANWKSFDSFMNGCLLRRPRREFKSEAGDFSASSRWADFGDVSLASDPRLLSTVRYFTRDIGHLKESDERKTFEQLATEKDETLEQRQSRLGFRVSGMTPRLRNFGRHPVQDDWHFHGYSYAPDLGVAGWNDFSGAGHAARQSLKKAAGVTIPEATFVLKTLAIYLFVLVPLNWGIFRLIGKVEWAWIAAPVIAILGAIFVVRTAQLDIGFLRSRTELAILEMNDGYARGHLTRYSALYTSLSTGYDLAFEDPSAISLPFSVDEDYKRKISDFPSQTTFRRDAEVTLSGFQVGSNSTGMIHSEQMYAAGGSLKLTGDADALQLKNETKLPLNGVGVVRRNAEGGLEGAWIGELAAQSSSVLRFQPLAEPFFPEWEQSAVTKTCEEGLADEVNLYGVMSLALQRLRLPPGEIRLIGYYDGELPGVTFRPAAAQSTVRTMVLCHLRRASLPTALPDKNLQTDYEEEEKNETSEDQKENPAPAPPPSTTSSPTN